MSIADDATTGQYWLPYGHAQIGTYAVVDTGSLTLFYEAHPALPDISSTDAADEGTLPVPIDWEQALLDFVQWRVFERVERGDRKLASWHRDQYMEFKRRVLGNRHRNSDTREPKIGRDF